MTRSSVEAVEALQLRTLRHDACIRHRNRAELVSENNIRPSGHRQRQCQQYQNYPSPHFNSLPSFSSFPFFHLGTSCPRYRSPLLLEHLRFQNYRTLLLVIYQQLNNIYRDCPESRNAICCILATIRFPRSPNPAGGLADYETEQPWVRNRWGKSLDQKENLSLGDPLPEPC